MTTSADPLIGASFGVKVDGVPLAMFSGISGISIEIEVVEHKTVNDKGHPLTIKVPGRPKYSDIVLKRGMTMDDGLYKWMKETVEREGGVKKKTCAITCYDGTYSPVAEFSFEGCWPTKLSVSDLTAGSDDVAVEEMTIKHEALFWA